MLEHEIKAELRLKGKNHLNLGGASGSALQVVPQFPPVVGERPV